LAECGEILVFVPGERIVVPDRHDGWSFLLLRGDVVNAQEYDIATAGNDATHPLDQLGRGAAAR
jgi:hypothetical protein